MSAKVQVTHPIEYSSGTRSRPAYWNCSVSTCWPPTRPVRHNAQPRQAMPADVIYVHVRITGLAGDGQFPGGVVHPLEAVLGADDNVLDPRTVRPRVDPRLDGERHARLQRFVVAGH